MFEECISVGTECEGNVQYLRVVERLLHTSTDGVVVVFGFHNSNREAGLIVEDLVDLLCFSPLYRLATNNDPPPGEIHFLPHLYEQKGTHRADIRTKFVTPAIVGPGGKKWDVMQSKWRVEKADYRTKKKTAL